MPLAGLGTDGLKQIDGEQMHKQAGGGAERAALLALTRARQSSGITPDTRARQELLDGGHPPGMRAGLRWEW